MFKNMSPRALGLTGRQSELIELALTYGFRGMDVDMADLAKRARNTSLAHAIRYLESAKLRIGNYDLPIDWQGDDTAFRSQLTLLEEACQVAAALDARRCVWIVEPASDERPFQENFEFHRQRLAQVADVLAKFDIQLGLGLRSLKSQREGRTYQFICEVDALLTLVKSIPAGNVGVLVDTFHWFLGGGSMSDLSDLDPEKVVGLRLADYARDEDPNEFDESARRLPGAGGVDCQAVVNLFVQKKYDGPATLYVHPSRFRGMTRDGIVQKAAEVMDELWRGAGLSKPKPVAATAGEAAT
ncbi:MAG: xylose isomerase [Pirellulaceae bacterium]|nr:MAG: xylose isomerase [Pirellulaceae bacterium]